MSDQNIQDNQDNRDNRIPLTLDMLFGIPTVGMVTDDLGILYFSPGIVKAYTPQGVLIPPETQCSDVPEGSYAVIPTGPDPNAPPPPVRSIDPMSAEGNDFLEMMAMMSVMGGGIGMRPPSSSPNLPTAVNGLQQNPRAPRMGVNISQGQVDRMNTAAGRSTVRTATLAELQEGILPARYTVGGPGVKYTKSYEMSCDPEPNSRPLPKF